MWRRWQSIQMRATFSKLRLHGYRMKFLLPSRTLALSLVLVAAPLAAQSIVGKPKKGEPARVATIPTPESFFGFQMGADKKMAHWDDMVRYYDQLGRLSPRMKVVNMGRT